MQSTSTIAVMFLGLSLAATTAWAQNCPNPEGGDCCTATPMLPGCTDPACCEIVCTQDSYCCETEWDETCVNAANELCTEGGNHCSGGGGGGGDAKNDGCDEAIEVFLGDNSVTNIGATTNGPLDCDFFGNPQTWNDVWYSFEALDSGPLTVSTCDLVDWDSKIVVYTGGCAVLEWVGCNDDGDGCTGFTTLLTVNVVAGESYLIRLGSYSELATGSGTMRLSMAEPCDTSCPEGSIPEDEPCGTDFNGGCNLDPSGDRGVQYINVGDTICGTFWFDGYTQDTDWYEFTIDESMILNLDVFTDATISPVAYIVTSYCEPIILATGAGACPSNAVSDCLPAGTYRAFVATGFDSVLACGDVSSEYYFTLSATACELPPAPENDLCADAIVIEEGEHAFTTIDAQTDGPTTPNCSGYGSVNAWNDVWYLWTATMSGIAEVSTCNTVDYDSKLAAYDGTCTSLHEVGCNDDGPDCAGFSSIMVFPCEEGIEYLIRIGGYADGQTGSGTFELSVREPCDYAPPKGAVYEVETCMENYPDGINGGCNDPSGANPTQSIQIGDTVAGTWFFDGTYRDTDWYSLEVPAPGAEVTMDLRNYDGVTGLVFFLPNSCTAAYEYAAGGCPTSLTSFCVPAGTYWVVVAPDFGALIDCNDEVASNYTLTISSVECEALPPENDLCADAIEITDGDHEFTTIYAATDGPADCDFYGNFDTFNDVWFKYTATCSAPLTISTCNIVDYDSKIVLYENSGSCPPTFQVACNDDGDGCAGFSSLLIADVTEGIEYLIRVGGFADGAWGSGTLHVECDAADPCDGYGNSCETPEVIQGPGDYQINTTCAYQAGDRDVDLTGYCDPGEFGDDIVDNVYFLELTPVMTGDWTFTTCNQALYDTNLAVLGTCEPSSVVGCMDDTDGCEGFSTTLVAYLVAGETYLVCIGGYGEASYGTTTLTVIDPEEPPVDCVADLNMDGIVDGADLVILLGDWNGPGGDLTGDGTTNGEDLLILLGEWGDCPV